MFRPWLLAGNEANLGTVTSDGKREGKRERKDLCLSPWILLE